jgi:hypothetical protein
LGGGIITFLVIYFVPFHKDYIQMSFFLGTSKWESQNWDFYYPKTLDVHIFSNQVYFENAKAISYNPQKNLSKNV